MVICVVIGTRPQFIKHAAIVVEMDKHETIEHFSIHTGQHYDPSLNELVFHDLHLSQPDYQLDIGSHSHAKQTGLMMLQIEEVIQQRHVDCLIVYGDSNSTLAGALVAKKNNISLVHIEAGLRSYNLSMPEEINRIVTDKISDVLFAPSHTAVKNLEQESVFGRIFQVGDVMKDLVLMAQNENRLTPSIDQEYIYASIHRHYNTDDAAYLKKMLNALHHLSLPVIFSLHPRTRSCLQKWNISHKEYDNINFMTPPAYFENLSFIANSVALITDSGGMQKEAYWLKTKCLTFRPETEWIETIQNDWNTLVYDSFEHLQQLIEKCPGGHDPQLYGNGNAANIIVDILASI